MSSRVLGLLDPGYPAALRELSRPPGALYVRGELPRVPGVAIVGTRRPSDGGRAFAFELAATLASAGFAVWSGGALGVDQAAHEGALSARGVTVLVSGAGLDRPYPPGVEPLCERILVAGALLAVAPDDTPPQRHQFFRRNAVLAALSVATVVVECPLQSGARNTSAAARRLGRAVWLVPHAPWTEAGQAVREELRLGGSLLFNPGDLTASLGIVPPPRPRRPRPVPLQTPASATRDLFPADSPSSPASPLEARVLAALDAGPTHPDVLCERLGLSTAEVMVALTTLTLVGRVVETGQGTFARAKA